ncbi:MAG: hypothetical protein ABIA63_11875 [bacterium]
MISNSKDGLPYELCMKEGQKTYKIRKKHGELLGCGTSVIVGPMHSAILKVVTGDRLNSYLEIELRDRLKGLKVSLEIYDRVSRKKFNVKPRKFMGSPLTNIKESATPKGNVKFELYLDFSKNGEDSGVALCKDGTRVLENLHQAPALDHEPWTNPALAGVIDCPFIQLSPGARDAIVPDDNYQILVKTLGNIEKQILESIDQLSRVEEEKASKTILKDIKRAFENALNELPDKDYLFFDVDNGKKSNRKNYGAAFDEKLSPVQTRDQIQKLTFPELPGELAFIKIRPKVAVLSINQTKHFTATALDERGQDITDSTEFTWSLEPDSAGIINNFEGAETDYSSNSEGFAELCVSARKDRITLTARARIRIRKVEREQEDILHGGGQGLPTYKLIADFRGNWRSKYQIKTNTIEINSAHTDYITCRYRMAKMRKYIAKLYAKEIVLINFINDKPEQITERMIELLVRIEESL